MTAAMSELPATVTPCENTYTSLDAADSARNRWRGTDLSTGIENQSSPSEEGNGDGDEVTVYRRQCEAAAATGGN